MWSLTPLARRKCRNHGRQLDLLDAGSIGYELKKTGNGDVGVIGPRETDPDGVGE